MVIYLIGSTTQYPLSIAGYLTGSGHNVIKLGRDTLDYTDPAQMETEFSKYPDPDVVVFNQRVVGGATPKYKRRNVADTYYLDHVETFKKENDDNLQQTMYGKLAIYDILSHCKQFIFITSSVTLGKEEYGFENLSYRYLRSAEQQLMKCIAIEPNNNAYGICPGGMDQAPELWAEATARIINGDLDDSEYETMNGEVTLISHLMKSFFKTHGITV